MAKSETHGVWVCPAECRSRSGTEHRVEGETLSLIDDCALLSWCMTPCLTRLSLSSLVFGYDATREDMCNCFGSTTLIIVHAMIYPYIRTSTIRESLCDVKPYAARTDVLIHLYTLDGQPAPIFPFFRR